MTIDEYLIGYFVILVAIGTVLVLMGVTRK